MMSLRLWLDLIVKKIVYNAILDVLIRENGHIYRDGVDMNCYLASLYTAEVMLGCRSRLSKRRSLDEVMQL